MRCTSSTLAKSAASILPNDLSRRMPALAQSRSTLPHSLVARATIAFTCSKFETSAPSAIAVPPAFLISSTTLSAGVSDPPVPSRAPPKSLTTTLAPRLARPSACARPRPLPAPVTMATRPSNLIVIVEFPSLSLPSCPASCRASTSSLSLHQSDVDGRDKPGHDALPSGKIDQADPVGHQSGLLFALDLNGDAGARLQFLWLAQFRFRQRKPPAHTRARSHRR